ncbi:MAG TPA: tRNA isopentenyl-2-thiomethyl-A-37 hydroxylase MiaE [Steroidobacteraceae bacterium]|nr:tRNA isopentenyl-2-thiomethyl-A-37 hydroxylase MiaE [Steroidobacteraceae bacterium]
MSPRRETPAHDPLPESILGAPTPHAWTLAAAARLPELLVDHANCEKKAASSAMALIFAYPEDTALVLALSRLAREELRHFEQVHRAMRELGIAVVRQRPGRYAHELRRALRTTHPERKLDLLLAAALIEARSAERFALLAQRLPAPLTALYRELADSERRHFELYLEFARERAPSEWRVRLAELSVREAQLATAPDTELRFHSGPPPAAN